MSNTIAILYQYIYLLLVLLLTIPQIIKYSKIQRRKMYQRIVDKNSPTFILASFFTIFIGLRPISEIFVDMPQYLGIYERWNGIFEFSIDTENIIYDNLMYWLASIRFEPTLFYVLIASIYFLCTYKACKRFFPNNSYSSYLVFLAAFSTFSYATNGIKAGAAAAIFLLALSFLQKKTICIILVLISWGMHHSMQLPIAALIISILFKNAKYYYYGWMFCLLMAIMHITFFQGIFAGISDEKGASYLLTNGEDFGGITGFRIDFVMYSAIPIIIGYVIEIKKKLRITQLYSLLLHTYICINSVWLLCMYVNFTNRIAYLSWFMYPVVLIYPFLRENLWLNQYKTYSKIMAYHLAFTIFMVFIYYGGLIKLIKL